MTIADRENPLVFMFAGQGSQAYHMGKELYQNDECFRRVMNELDNLAKDYGGLSIVQELYNDANKKTTPFNNILITHPAIFMVEYSLAQSVMEKGIKPDYVLGASLGELTAAALCDVLSVEQALKLVISQAQMFHQKQSQGGMMAILNDIKLYEQISEFHENADIAAINFDGNFIVAGDEAGLQIVEQYLLANNIVFMRLPVLQPFHSSKLDVLKIDFNALSAPLVFNQASIPFISCATSSVLQAIDQEHIWQVYRDPINIYQTIQNLESRGSYTYVDLGPGGTMANLVKYNSHVGKSSEVYAVMSPFGSDLKGFNQILSALA